VNGDPVTRDNVIRAAETIRGRVRRTPLLDGSSLAPGLRLKAELLQHTGSFKARGVINRLSALGAEERAHGVAGASAGNHAMALAWGAAAEGLDCRVFSWPGGSRFKLDRARALGAVIDIEAADPGDAFARLERYLEETGSVLVHPFDDPLVISGQGTVGLEILEDVPDAGVIVVPCGGGGLVSGIALAADGRRVVVAVEPELSPALNRGLAAGRSVPVEPASIADGLSAPFAGELPVEICGELGVESVLVTEQEIVDGMHLAYGRAKLACEPAGAVGIAALLARKVAVGEGQTTVVVVSGGNVAPETASAILARP
jgi:threonine dehydratase